MATVSPPPDQKDNTGFDRRFQPRSYVPDLWGNPVSLQDLAIRHHDQRLKSQTISCAVLGAAALFVGLITVKGGGEARVIVSALQPWLGEGLAWAVLAVILGAGGIVAIVSAMGAASSYDNLNLASKICLLAGLVATGRYFQDRLSVLDYSGALLLALFAALVLEAISEASFVRDPNLETVVKRRQFSSALGVLAAAAALLALAL